MGHSNVPFDEWAILYRHTYTTHKDYPVTAREHHIEESRKRGIGSTSTIYRRMQWCIFGSIE